VIVLVFDITRRETFEALDYWHEQVRISRGTNKASIILVGNKIDVGGSAVPIEDIKRFSERICVNRYYTTSAMIGKGVKELLEGISGAVEWSELLKSFNEKIGVSIGEYIKKKSKERKIERRIELIKSILNDFKGTDELEVNAILNYYISQAIIQISKNEEYIILDPEYVDKRIGRIISEASERDGVIEITRMQEIMKLGRNEMEDIIDYILKENICYKASENIIVFPNVIHKTEVELEEYLIEVLNSNPIEEIIKFRGPGDVIFLQYSAIMSKEIGNPEYISNIAGAWKRWSGKDTSVIVIMYIKSQQGGVIRLKSGGGRGNEMMQQALSILKSILESHALSYEKVDNVI